MNCYIYHVPLFCISSRKGLFIQGRSILNISAELVDSFIRFEMDINSWPTWFSLWYIYHYNGMKYDHIFICACYVSSKIGPWSPFRQCQIMGRKNEYKFGMCIFLLFSKYKEGQFLIFLPNSLIPSFALRWI
jgi:hypothetical protein